MGRENIGLQRVMHECSGPAIFMDVYNVAVQNNIPSWVDSAMWTTMTLDDMSEHQGAPCTRACS